MSEIADNIYKIKEEIDRRNPGCEIVAATKTRTLDEIREAMDTGLISAAGENRVQELTEKFTPEFKWDLIGRLQTNKVKYVVDKVRLIHGVDRISLAEQIEKECVKKGVKSRVLIEINTGKEESKGGIFLEDAEKFLSELAVFPNIEVCGLMAVAERTADTKYLRHVFDEVYGVFDRLRNDVFRYLSMGMSEDYKIALDCGSNLIRPGRIIFGERVYGKDERGEGN